MKLKMGDTEIDFIMKKTYTFIKQLNGAYVSKNSNKIQTVSYINKTKLSKRIKHLNYTTCFRTKGKDGLYDCDQIGSINME